MGQWRANQMIISTKDNNPKDLFHSYYFTVTSQNTASLRYITEATKSKLENTHFVPFLKFSSLALQERVHPSRENLS
jgi:hypothetical protein